MNGIGDEDLYAIPETGAPMEYERIGGGIDRVGAESVGNAIRWREGELWRRIWVMAIDFEESVVVDGRFHVCSI